MRIVKATLTITNNHEVHTTDIPVSEYTSIADATKHLGEEKVLEYINYAQQLHDRNRERRKFIAAIEAPEKLKWLEEQRKTKRLR